jgi:hypothetical protein
MGMASFVSEKGEGKFCTFKGFKQMLYWEYYNIC